jgi:hypothetical protein
MPFHFYIFKVSALEFAQRGEGGNEGLASCALLHSIMRAWTEFFMAYLKHFKPCTGVKISIKWTNIS